MQKLGTTTLTMLVSLLLAAVVAGCADQKKDSLKTGYQALEEKQYDQAMAQADEFLSKTPHGPGSAEALYLRGRALEEKVAADDADARAKLQAARNAYTDALALSPGQPLQSYIHTSLGNVAYFQEDFPGALDQWREAFDHLDKPEIKSWVLYRIGLCQQRLGQFVIADQTFANVQEQFPNTEPAERAKEHVGARAFYVQVGTYDQPSFADKAMLDLRQSGMTPTKSTDVKGRTVVRAGPFATYAQAKQGRLRVTARYGDAIIVP